MLITVSGSRTDSYRNAFTSQATQSIWPENWTQSTFSGTLPKVSATRLLAGALLIGSFAGVLLAGQDGSAPAFPAPTITIRDASALTNAPTPAMVTVVPEPALPEVTVPKPTEVAVPSATAIQSGPVAPAARPQPVMPPTAQGLLSKSMQSGPTGPAGKLASIASPPSPASLTNSANNGVEVASPINSPTTQSNIWQKSTPALNGVDYHW
jgi:hypothetical protein